MVRTVASVLIAEGYRCSVSTPAGAVRITFDPSSTDFIEIGLDTASDPPTLVGRTARARGRRVVSDEQVIAAHPTIGELSEEALLAFFLQQLVPFVER